MRTIDSQVPQPAKKVSVRSVSAVMAKKQEFPPSEEAADQTMSFVCQGTLVWFCKALAINRNAAAELFISLASHALKGRGRSCAAVGSLDGRKNCSEKRQGKTEESGPRMPVLLWMLNARYRILVVRLGYGRPYKDGSNIRSRVLRR